MGTASNYAVFEDLTTLNGHLLFLDTAGVKLDLEKTSESDIHNPTTLYLGHSEEQVKDSKEDLLGKEILARGGDPDYEKVENVLPRFGLAPSDNAAAADNLVSLLDTKVLEGIVGTPDSEEKVCLIWGGRTVNFDPAPLQPTIRKIRAAGAYLQGLVGGELPAIRFVYPEANGDWTELLAFAPFRLVNGNARIQPVWYRVSRVEGGILKWTRYVDSYQTATGNNTALVENGRRFYTDLALFHDRWRQILSRGIQISIPDKRLEHMARYSLLVSMMTRVGDYPKYGVHEAVFPDYGANEHDGFPDTFTTETSVLLDWGLVDLAGRYIGNYFGSFVQDDGSILYRGPELGQYGKMLAVVAKYLDIGGDPEVVLAHRDRIEAIVGYLLALRSEATQQASDDPAYGMIKGWSEADSSLTIDPPRYAQPYFSNSAEAVSGFEQLGEAWQALGLKRNDASMVSLGQRMLREGAALRRDLDVSLSRSLIKEGNEQYLPAIAGADLLPDAAQALDSGDPQWPSYRVFMEMLDSGALEEEQIGRLRRYLSTHHGVLLGMPSTTDTSRHLTSWGLRSDGFAYALLQDNHIREVLLMLYSQMAHQYTRGTWIAPEERDPLASGWLGYSSVAQLIVPSILRWLLVFEDPKANTLWLGKGIPTAWFEDGRRVAVSEVPTRWGRVSYSVISHREEGKLEARVTFPVQGIGAQTRLRLRAGAEFHARRITVNGKRWADFDTAAQEVVLPSGTGGLVRIEVAD
jgi:hypothetical protein